MRRAPLCLALALVPLCGGCATVARGSRQTLRFHTVPEQAMVVVDGQRHVTPFQVSLRRKDSHAVVISMDGYRTLRFSIDPQWDGVSLVGNLIIPGGSVGLLIDRYDGADRSFHALAEIKLIPATRPSDPAITLNDFKGHLMSDKQVAAAVRDDRHDRAQFFRGEP